MVVVGHLALGVDQPVEPRAHLAEHAIENLAVGLVQIDVFVPVTPCGDMVHGASELHSQRSGHRLRLAEGTQKAMTPRVLTPSPSF